jgi:hypothetical protein
MHGASGHRGVHQHARFQRGLIVLIRTFLSFELTLEIEGRWPWQRPTRDDAAV